MQRWLLLCALALTANAHAQNFTLSISSNDFVATPVFSDVTTFDIEVVVEGNLAPGAYNNPQLVSVTYSVAGDLASGTPSGFPSFALLREIDGADFYAQGSLLIFEVADTAVLSDGLQVAELVGGSLVFTFNGREIGNGRFHPALFQLNADGTGLIQNSNNVVQEVPLVEVGFGEEYVTGLAFDPGNLTIVGAAAAPPPTGSLGSGGGAVSLLFFAVLWCAVMAAAMRRRWAT
ncbi:MAG: hypothetical protein AAFR09_08395 [Pseudomonadota bacterium]